MPWPAEGAKSAESGSRTSPPLLGPGLEACLIQLIAALHEQAAAINRLASSNEALVQAMSEGEGIDDPAPSVYMGGSPVRVR